LKVLAEQVLAERHGLSGGEPVPLPGGVPSGQPVPLPRSYFSVNTH
jgi:hypothetical protein